MWIQGYPIFRQAQLPASNKLLARCLNCLHRSVFSKPLCPMCQEYPVLSLLDGSQSLQAAHVLPSAGGSQFQSRMEIDYFRSELSTSCWSQTRLRLVKTPAPIPANRIVKQIPSSWLAASSKRTPLLQYLPILIILALSPYSLSPPQQINANHMSQLNLPIFHERYHLLFTRAQLIWFLKQHSTLE